MALKTLFALLLSGTTLICRAQTSPVATVPKPDLAALFTRIWRITHPTPDTNSASIFIILRNGTMLDTSCVEIYRVATWKLDPKNPDTLEVTEDGRLAFTAKVLSVGRSELHLQQTMALGNHEVRELALTAIDKEFLCPDMPK